MQFIMYKIYIYSQQLLTYLLRSPPWLFFIGMVRGEPPVISDCTQFPHSEKRNNAQLYQRNMSVVYNGDYVMHSAVLSIFNYSVKKCFSCFL